MARGAQSALLSPLRAELLACGYGITSEPCRGAPLLAQGLLTLPASTRNSQMPSSTALCDFKAAGGLGSWGTALGFAF